MARVKQDASAKRASQRKDTFIVSVLTHWRDNVAKDATERGMANAVIIETNRRMAARIQDKSLSVASIFGSDED